MMRKSAETQFDCMAAQWKEQMKLLDASLLAKTATAECRLDVGLTEVQPSLVQHRVSAAVSKAGRIKAVVVPKSLRLNCIAV